MYIVIFITASSKKEAQVIVKGLLKEKLIACANIIDKVESFFWWRKKIDRAKEALIIAKSKKEKLAKIISAVKSRHSYETPEIIALPVIVGFSPYLRWIDDSLRHPY